MDPRQEAYDDLHGEQLRLEQEANAKSAALILKRVCELVPVASVLDVGCGIGTWLEAASNAGVADIQGIEGEWLDPKRLRVASDRVSVVDLEKPFELGRKFDLVVTLEVAEHLSKDAAQGFVQSLVAHGEVVLFSAAIPFQGGHHHLNEQFLPYWRDLFAEHGYSPVDAIRPLVWDNDDVLWWLRQNIILFASNAALKKHKALAAAVSTGPLSLVHPLVYYSRCVLDQREVLQLSEFVNQMSQPGTYKVRVVNGQPVIRKVGN